MFPPKLMPRTPCRLLCQLVYGARFVYLGMLLVSPSSDASRHASLSRFGRVEAIESRFAQVMACLNDEELTLREQ